MSWLRITNTMTGKIELEVGEKPDNFFIKCPADPSSPKAGEVKSKEQLQKDIQLMGSVIDRTSGHARWIEAEKMEARIEEENNE